MPHRTRPMTGLLMFSGLNVVLVSTIEPVYDFVCFLPYWERRDNVTKMTIGIGKERDGLYYLEDHRDISDISMVPLQGELESKEEEQLWLGEKKIWISGPESPENFINNGESLVLDNLPTVEPLDGRDKIKRSSKLFEQKYSRRREPLEPNTSLDDSTMPLDDSSKTGNEVCVYSSEPELEPEPESLESFDPNSSMNRRYPFRERKAPDRLGFSKTSNVVYPISNFISYHHLSKANLAFALQLSSIYLYS